VTAPTSIVDEDALDRISSLLDMRRPNRDAVLSLAHRLSRDTTGEFEGVLDLATGVGKTYCIAGIIDYMSETAGVRNYVIVVPGRTILQKTIDNFSAGGRKSLVEKMSTRPHLITADAFDTPSIRSTLDNPEEVKLFVFTVQSLIGPKNEQRKKVHKFQEGLGENLYKYLQGADDLVVLADEHHCYYGPQFSSAIRDLTPYALVGLTATPHKKTPEAQIVFRYPLAHAIAEKYVKTPVIVGRKDDRKDTETKLRDGLTLLAAKDTALHRHCEAEGLTRVNPIMLVVAPDITYAKEVEDLLADPDFFNGVYADAVLRIDSSSPDESLAALAEVEDPGSKVRVIVSVGMLKEGWDVANVYVIVSLRPNVSEILTEQTMGRGLRLPFGRYTDVELLDTLEVVAHERFEELLQKSKVLKEKVVDWRNFVRDATDDPTPPPVPTDKDPATGGVPGTTPPGTEPTPPGSSEAVPAVELEMVLTDASVPVAATDVITATTVESRTEQVEAEAEQVAELKPRTGVDAGDDPGRRQRPCPATVLAPRRDEHGAVPVLRPAARYGPVGRAPPERDHGDDSHRRERNPGGRADNEGCARPDLLAGDAHRPRGRADRSRAAFARSAAGPADGEPGCCRRADRGRVPGRAWCRDRAHRGVAGPGRRWAHAAGAAEAPAERRRRPIVGDGHRDQLRQGPHGPPQDLAGPAGRVH